jgi:dTDP-glucose 4,6-dehydratase
MRFLLVTGGCGFIGSNFIQLALNTFTDIRIINLDKLTYAGNPLNLAEHDTDPRYHFIKGDICDQKLVEKIFLEENVDTVAHFAAESHVDRSILGPAEFIHTNIIGTFNLLEVARKTWSDKKTVASPKFLHVSTDEVYGSLGADGFFTEDSPYDPRSPYSASKASSDHLVRAYYHTYGLPAVMTNCSNNYGPYQFPEKLIPLIIHNAQCGKELPVYGDGKNIRDWLYVTDHCRALLAVLGQGKVGETYNVGGNSEKQNLEVVNIICDILDSKLGLLPGSLPRRSLIRFVQDRAGHDRRYAIDASKIRDELGWAPSVLFEEGIQDTIDWYLCNQEWVARIVDGSYLEYYKTMYGDRLA